MNVGLFLPAAPTLGVPPAKQTTCSILRRIDSSMRRLKPLAGPKHCIWASWPRLTGTTGTTRTLNTHD